MDIDIDIDIDIEELGYNCLNNLKNYHYPIWNSSLTSHYWYCYSIMSSFYKCIDSIQNFDDNDDKPDDNMWTKAIQLDNGCLTWTVSCCHWQYPTNKIKIPTESFFSHIYHPPYLFKKENSCHVMILLFFSSVTTFVKFLF